MQRPGVVNEAEELVNLRNVVLRYAIDNDVGSRGEIDAAEEE